MSEHSDASSVEISRESLEKELEILRRLEIFHDRELERLQTEFTSMPSPWGRPNTRESQRILAASSWLRDESAVLYMELTLLSQRVEKLRDGLILLEGSEDPELLERWACSTRIIAEAVEDSLRTTLKLYLEARPIVRKVKISWGNEEADE